MNYVSYFVQTARLDVKGHGIGRCFHTYRRCPVCRCDMLTDGRGKFLCDYCGYADRRDVAELKRKYGYHGDGRRLWNSFVFGGER